MQVAFEKSSSLRIEVLIGVAILSGLVLFVPTAMAQDAGFVKACGNVYKFFKNFETILKVASVTIVTIAVVFSGYQIAFAHKRLSDVAPVLIGGLLIGGAATIAGWFIEGWGVESGTSGCTKASVDLIEKHYA